MDIKEEIKNVLFSLKRFKVDRRMAEKELGYAEFAIDSEVSRGGNERMLILLKLLLKVKTLENTIKELRYPEEPRKIEDLQPLEGIEGDRAIITALVQAVLELQEVVFKDGNKPKVKLLENASSILKERLGRSGPKDIGEYEALA